MTYISAFDLSLFFCFKLYEKHKKSRGIISTELRAYLRELPGLGDQTKQEDLKEEIIFKSLRD